MKGLNKALGKLLYELDDPWRASKEGLCQHPKDRPGAGPHVRLQKRTWGLTKRQVGDVSVCRGEEDRL